MHLSDRAVIRVSPSSPEEDVVDFLQGLVTNDVGGKLPVYAGLLTPQGKALFDFLVWPGEDDALLIDCEASAAEDVVRRLSLYRLRRKIEIAIEPELGVFWSPNGDEDVPDPRLDELGTRSIGPASENRDKGDDAWRKHRLALGVPEGRDELGDILWLETNSVELNGVAFDKGCYVGQENTARMNWRQKVNRRLVVVPLDRSEEKRRKAVHEDLALAIDHLRVADIDPVTLPDWQREALSAAG